MAISFKTMRKRIIIGEIAGFLFLIFVIWLDEIIDYYGDSQHGPAEFEYDEAFTESAGAIVFGVIVIIFTLRLLKRVKYLEGFLAVCSFCKKIRIDDKWIPMEEYIAEHSEAEFSHSFCPDCMEKHYGHIMDDKKHHKD